MKGKKNYAEIIRNMSDEEFQKLMKQVRIKALKKELEALEK